MPTKIKRVGTADVQSPGGLRKGKVRGPNGHAKPWGQVKMNRLSKFVARNELAKSFKDIGPPSLGSVVVNRFLQLRVV